MVGVSNDHDIGHHKGPTVMKDEERYLAVEGCKWVDEIVRDAPYTTELECLEKHNIDFCVHGEDPSIDADGKDTYEEVKKAGRFRCVFMRVHSSLSLSHSLFCVHCRWEGVCGAAPSSAPMASAPPILSAACCS